MALFSPLWMGAWALLTSALLSPVSAHADLECLRGISGIFIYSFTGPTWAAAGREPAESLCVTCQASPTPAARAECMDQGILNGWTVSGASAPTRGTRARYEEELRQFARSAIRERAPATGGSLPAPSAAEITAELNNLTAACPDVTWATVSASNSQGFGRWLRARDCVIQRSCRDLDEAAQASCEQGMTSTSLGMEMRSLEYFQARAATEAIRDGHSVPQEINFTEGEDVVAAAPSPRPAPSAAPGRTHGITPRQFRNLSADAAARTGQQEDAYAAATHARMGCPSNATYTMADGSVRCITTGYAGTPTVIARTMTDVSAAVNKLVYRDLTRFAVQQVWESYTVALLMDPSVTGGSCASESSVREDILTEIGTDAWAENRTNPVEARTALAACFAGSPDAYNRDTRQLGMGSRIDDLAQTAANMRCRRGGDPGARDNSCDSREETDDRGSGRAAQARVFQRRAQDLHLLEEREALLRAGNFRVGGTRLTCGSRGCANFFTWMQDCAPDYRVSAGCIPPDALPTAELTAYQAMENLKSTRNYILTQNPELASEVLTLDDNGDRVTWPAWRVTYRGTIARRNAAGTCPYNGGRRPCDQILTENFDQAIKASRRKKLDLILSEACDDPEKFAKKMLLTNPDLINRYLDQGTSPDMGSLLCVGLSEAQADERAHAWTRAGATALTLALGMAAAIPTAGSSLALTLGALSAAGAVGMTVADLSAAYSRARLESGLHHGCIGDYNRAREAEEALEDAMIRAAIDLGVGVGIFAGMTAVQKIAELRRLSAIARGVDGVAPAWAGSVETAARATTRLGRAERALIMEEYGLAEIPGLARNGRLTREGRRAADAVGELEALGIPRDVIRRAVNSCTR